MGTIDDQWYLVWFRYLDIFNLNTEGKIQKLVKQRMRKGTTGAVILSSMRTKAN